MDLKQLVKLYNQAQETGEELSTIEYNVTFNCDPKSTSNHVWVFDSEKVSYSLTDKTDEYKSITKSYTSDEPMWFAENNKLTQETTYYK